MAPAGLGLKSLLIGHDKIAETVDHALADWGLRPRRHANHQDVSHTPDPIG
jgi:hypothetical protein